MRAGGRPSIDLLLFLFSRHVLSAFGPKTMARDEEDEIDHRGTEGGRLQAGAN